jgi:rare lipoprotein A
MKRFIIFSLLGLFIAFPAFAQQTASVTGLGSWYNDENSSGLFASHATFPFGTQLRVTNLENNRQITVQVGGRLPKDPRWIIDISVAGADELEMHEVGFTRVRVEEIPRENRPRALRSNSSNIRKFFQTGFAELWTAAASNLQIGHPSLAIGTRLRVTNRVTGRKLAVTVGTRIRADQTRIVSISKPAADSLGLRFERGGASSAQVTLESTN